MFKQSESNAAVSNSIAKLKERAVMADLRVRQTSENSSKKEEQAKAIRIYTILQKRLDVASKVYAEVIKAIQEYLDNKQKDSSTAITSAIRTAIQIVPDCDPNISLQCVDGEAWIGTPDGIEVDRLDGSGFRSTLSVLLREIVLRFNPQSLQTMVLDEVFSKLHAENSATLSAYLPILAQTMQIISIEQKPEVFANTPHIAYEFKLDGDVTVVRREEVLYD